MKKLLVVALLWSAPCFAEDYLINNTDDGRTTVTGSDGYISNSWSLGGVRYVNDSNGNNAIGMNGYAPAILPSAPAPVYSPQPPSSDSTTLLLLYLLQQQQIQQLKQGYQNQ